METINVTPHDAGGWQAEDEKGRGNWCYAAATKVIRGALLGETRSQQEIAHDFYLRLNALGGAAVAGVGGTRGAAIDGYAKAIGLALGAEPVPFSHVEHWVAHHQLAKDPLPLLGDAWGEVELSSLIEDRVNSLTADDDTEARISATILAGGLALIGTSMHYLIIHGYQADMEKGQVLAMRFHLWDPTNGTTKVVDLADYAGSVLSLITG